MEDSKNSISGGFRRGYYTKMETCLIRNLDSTEQTRIFSLEVLMYWLWISFGMKFWYYGQLKISKIKFLVLKGENGRK